MRDDRGLGMDIDGGHHVVAMFLADIAGIEDGIGIPGDLARLPGRHLSNFQFMLVRHQDFSLGYFSISIFRNIRLGGDRFSSFL